MSRKVDECKPLVVGLWMLPTFGGRGGRKAGTLEAHTNGMRYVGAKADETVDVMYSNVKVGRCRLTVSKSV